MGRGMGVEFLTTLCALHSFINALYIELLRKRNIFRRGGGGGGGINWSLWLGEITGFPPPPPPFLVRYIIRYILETGNLPRRFH